MTTPQNMVSESSTAISTRKELDEGVIVRFSSACPLCKNLAHFMQQRVSADQILFAPAAVEQPNELVIEFDGYDEANVKRTHILSGEDAWLWLLEHHPSLKDVNWLAQKIGISRDVAQWTRRTGAFLKRFCLRCPSR